MSNRNIYNAARGYMVANAIAGGVASELAAEMPVQHMIF